MNNKLRFGIAIFFMFFGLQVFAEGSPVGLLQNASDRMIAELKAKKMVLKNQPAAVHGMVRRILLPYVDMNVLSRGVLGPYWAQASAEQRAQFTERFTTIVINTYASALAAYSNETVKFLPVPGGYEGRQTVKVDSQIIRIGAPSIPVSYRLIKLGGSWKVYDLIVDNVSLVQSYRSQFGSILRNKGGMTGLLAAMATHNATPR